MAKAQKFNHFLGIDVSADKIDVYNFQTQKHVTIKNVKANIRKFCKTLTPLDDLLVVIDLTGGHEQICVDIFHAFGFHIHRAEGRGAPHWFAGCDGQEASAPP